METEPQGEAVQRLVAALQAPPTPQELAGEQAVVQAFAAIGPDRGPDRGPGRRVLRAVDGTARAPGVGHRRRTRAQAVAIAVAGLVTLGVTASAAYSGSITRPVQALYRAVTGGLGLSSDQPAPRPTPTPATTLPAAGGPPTRSTSPDPSARGADSAPTRGPKAPAAPTEERSAAPTTEPRETAKTQNTPNGASVAVLCQAYVDGRLEGNSPRLKRLAGYAGGKSKIPGYCAEILDGR